MRICRALVLLSLTSLVGCASTPPINYTHYTLTPGGQTARLAKTRPRYATVLEVEQIAAPAWLRTRDIYYQLAYHNKQTISAYSRARWTIPPAEMIRSLLQDRLASLGAWHAVIGPETEVHADLTLHMRLTAFQQRFTSPGRSYGVLAATVTLIDNRNDDVVGQQDFDIRVDAPTANAAGAVQALNRANHKLADALEKWLLSSMKAN
jgi:cholesterol transport system auxiliary component